MTEYNDKPVKWMLYPSIIFMVIGMLVGVFASVNGFILPDYFAGEYIHFGRIRPVHVSHVTLLWLLAADMGLIYYIVQRLTGVPLWSHKLAIVTTIGYWGSVTLGTYSLPFGTNAGWEYAELPMLLGFLPIKWLVEASWGLFAVNIFMTIANRKYKKMYVSLWYTMGTLLWTTFVYAIGNLIMDLVPYGISRVNVNFFYVHNLVGLTFTPLGVAIAYYFIPKTANTPLYSHKLSMIGFWSIAFVYAWIGAHHMMHGPISQWLQTVAVVFSVWLWIPVWTVVTNFFATMKGQWGQYATSAPVRFLMMGTVFYLLVCLQGPLQALRNVNEITSKTDWIIGHAHMALYGTFTFFAIGGIYHAIPQMVRKPLWSQALADWHFTLSLVGGMVFFVSLWVGGFLQGLTWANWVNGSSYAEFHNNLSQMSFLQTVSDMWVWWALRSFGGALIAAGGVLFAINMFNTVVLKGNEEMQKGAEA
ncbi:MAG: cytochrome oxidase [Waddliaceae bacterium]|nr:cytochrome oxidase [Waddliaceae bacterium]